MKFGDKGLIGIDPTSIVPLSLIEDHLIDSVPNAQARFEEVGAAWIESRYGAPR